MQAGDTSWCLVSCRHGSYDLHPFTSGTSRVLRLEPSAPGLFLVAAYGAGHKVAVLPFAGTAPTTLSTPAPKPGSVP